MARPNYQRLSHVIIILLWQTLTLTERIDENCVYVQISLYIIILYTCTMSMCSATNQWGES